MMVKPLPLWLFTAALIALVTLSVSLGPYKIDWAQLTYDVVQNNKTIDTIVFFELRIPRTIMCILTGIALGTGGAALQILLRNPLAEPSIIGISSSAALRCCPSYEFPTSSGQSVFYASGRNYFLNGGRIGCWCLYPEHRMITSQYFWWELAYHF